MTKEERDNLIPGMKVKARIQGKPEREKFHLYSTQGIQSDDIGGSYEILPPIPDVWVEATIIEAQDKKGKLRKFVQWINRKGLPAKRLLYKFKNNDIIIKKIT